MLEKEWLRKKKDVVTNHAIGHAWSVCHTNLTLSSPEYSGIVDRLRCICESVSISRPQSASSLQTFSDFQYPSSINWRYRNNKRFDAARGSGLRSDITFRCDVLSAASCVTKYFLSSFEPKLWKYYFFRQLAGIFLLALRFLLYRRWYIQGVTGGRDKTSGECSLCYNIPI